MLTSADNRLDPSELDRETLDQLVAAFSQPDHVTILDAKGRRTELPEPLYRHLIRIVTMMREGRAVIMLPEDESFTTQAAANFLGMSRQFFVDLLEKGEIPHHRVGAHRRVYFKDLLFYQGLRDKTRREILDELGRKVIDAGLYVPKSSTDSKDAG